MLKSKKMIVSFVLVAMLLIAFSTTGLAQRSYAEFECGSGVNCGKCTSLRVFDRYYEMEARSASTYITGYIRYDNSDHLAKRIYKGDNYCKRNVDIKVDRNDVRSKLEAIWGGDHWARQWIED
jgi:hypothetical protein